MPWGPKDAKRFTKKANTPTKKRQFSHVADKVLEETGDEGRAIREANAAVAKNHGALSHNAVKHVAKHAQSKSRR